MCDQQKLWRKLAKALGGWQVRMHGPTGGLESGQVQRQITVGYLGMYVDGGSQELLD